MTTDALLKHDCRKELRDHSLKATPARLAIMELLETSNSPIDVATISEFLNTKHIKTDPATVFRIMNIFTECGITKQLQFHEGKFRYELATQGDHHHLICESCGKIEDMSECNIPALENDILARKKFYVKRHALEFYGLCVNCRRNL